MSTLKLINLLAFWQIYIALFSQIDTILINPLPVPINTITNEYYPFWSDNESTLFYTRRLESIREITLFSIYNTKVEDSTFNWIWNKKGLKMKTYKRGFFERPQATLLMSDRTNFQGALTKNVTNTAIYLAADLGKVYGLGNYDILQSTDNTLNQNSFKNMGSDINTAYWESSPTINEDGNLLIFSSDRPGGLGNKDLYISFKNKDNHWSIPFNLGSKINSRQNDYAPYIYPDGRHVFFCSNRPGGVGQEDIYWFDLRDSFKIAPVLLDYPINTKYDDQSIVFKLNGQTAFLSSNRQFNNFDIFQVDFYGNKKMVNGLTWMQFSFFNAITHAPLKPIVTIKQDSLNLNKQAVFYNSTNEFGNLFEKNILYNLHISLENFWDLDTFILIHDSTDILLIDSFPLYPICKNQEIIWKDILFGLNSANLDSSSNYSLQKLVDFLEKNSKLHIEIIGHTDDLGTDDFNFILSQKRATAVVNYLILKGIDKNRLSATGLGATKPKYRNDSELNRILNRRIEIKIIN